MHFMVVQERARSDDARQNAEMAKLARDRQVAGGESEDSRVMKSYDQEDDDDDDTGGD